jgi:hypothetical protein
MDGLSNEALVLELRRGGRFVAFQFAISILVMSYKRSSNVYFVRSGESAVIRGLPFTLLTLCLGWWGIPWGPIFSIESLSINLKGGRDVTAELTRGLGQPSRQST